MTRINCGIPPSELTNKHLLAEHREIKRIPNAIAKGKFSMTNQPKEFIEICKIVSTRFENLRISQYEDI